MKKLLAIFGSMSMIALTTTSVVSCVITTPSKPRFSSLGSISSSVWNSKMREFNTEEIKVSDAPQKVETTSYLYYTIVDLFKNPDDVATYFEKNEVSYRVIGPLTGDDKDPKRGLLELSAKVGSQTIKIDNLVFQVSNKKRLAVDKAAPLTVSLDATSSNLIYSQLMTFINFYRTAKGKNPPEKYIYDSMYKFNSTLKNTAINQGLAKDYLPGYDETEKKLYESLGEQLAYLNDTYNESNKKVLGEIDAILAENNNEAVHDNIVKAKMKSFTLGNLTINLA